MDRRTLLDEWNKANISANNPNLPLELRAKAKKAADLADAALGMRDALERKMGSRAAFDQAYQASEPDPIGPSPYPARPNPPRSP